MLIKSAADIKNLEISGKLMGEILEKLTKLCEPGVSSFAIDAAAEKMIIKAGGRPAFKNYRSHPGDKPFPGTICAVCNEDLVHGIPRKGQILKNGDIFTIDIGMEWPASTLRVTAGKPQKNKGVFTDTAVTVVVGKIPEKTRELLRVTKESLEVGIKTALPGNSVAAIGQAIEQYVNSQGRYGIVRELTGHGVGHEVHEAPAVPNYYDPKLNNFILKPGMVIAIEPMIALGHWKIKTKDDGWTITMADNSLCAHFEHTVVITEKGNVVVTRRPSEMK